MTRRTLTVADAFSGFGNFASVELEPPFSSPAAVVHPKTSDAVQDHEIGKAAEHLVVADLLLQGYRAYLTDAGLPYDVVIDLGGRLLRMQVKSTRRPWAMPQRSSLIPGYLFHTRKAGKGGKRLYAPDEFDLIAFVALDIRAIAYIAFRNVSANMTVLRPPGHAPGANATRHETVDQFPIQAAIKALTVPQAS